MLKKASFLIVGLALVSLAPGCGRGVTAAEIAEDYGILNRLDIQPEIARIIQSGQADYMIQEGHARKRNYVKNVPGAFESRKVLVTEYLIHGEVYRVEVRRQINPLQNVNFSQIHYCDYKHGVQKDNIRGFEALKIYNTLKNDSFEAQPEIAYRAWRGLDKKVRPVRLMRGETPKWSADDDSLNLYIRTKIWPVTTLWLQGLNSDGRRETQHRGERLFAGDGPHFDPLFKDFGYLEKNFGHVEQSTKAHDFRWILSAPGPSVGVVPFINRHLYDAIKRGRPAPHIETEARTTSR